MATLRVELDVFSNVGATFDEEGNAFPSSTLDESIIAVAAEKLLGLDVPDESEKGYRRTDKVRALLDERIKEMVEERLKTVTFEEVDKAVREVIAEGWQTTDRYGTPTGQKLGLKGRVSEILGSSDGYSGGGTFIHRTAKEILDKALREELGKQIEEAKKAFRAQVDGVLQAKLRESLAESLGLKA